MSAHPIEVKSGKDYTVHSALNNLLKNPDYRIPAATVVSNEREIYQDDKVTYMPVYLVMFMEAESPQVDDSEYLFWQIFCPTDIKKKTLGKRLFLQTNYHKYDNHIFNNLLMFYQLAKRVA